VMCTLWWRSDKEYFDKMGKNASRKYIWHMAVPLPLTDKS